MINFPKGEPLMMPWCNSLSAPQARIEMFMNRHGLGIVVPDFVMPIFEPEPFTQDELRQMYRYKRYANISKLRSIIRKHKLTQ